MLLLDDLHIDARQSAVDPGAPLGALAGSIAADLNVVMARKLYVPKEKALLSRAGGRCEDDGAQLTFDPYAPDEHQCPACGRVYTGAYHHRWWVYWYQLWLAERGVNAALLHLLRGEARHGAFARDVALRYCEMYATYPNRDNVLGPTRLFFSTYLESIWLLNVCVMADLLETAGDRATADEMRVRIIRPSSALIAQYDEGLSNRQVWNNAALMAAALMMGDRAGAERVVRADSGVETHLSQGLLDDGTWYEGENYHLFAHRGLWYCVTLAETAGILIEPKLVARFQAGFAAPFATALPDFTLPSRKDSQYAISLRQPRFAELCELGLARGDDERLSGALAQLYSADVQRGDTNRGRSTADVERNLPGTSLTRADLGWRSLLHARPSLPPLERLAPKSAHLTGQGISVFRRDAGETYVALDWGQSGGGHGHPDRLNILFMQGKTRWLDDLGTGSYVDRSLHWYRSTLAHNAPVFDGRSQDRVDGYLLAHDERGGVGWTYAAVDDVVPGVRVTRAVIVTPDYFVDELRWSADHHATLFLPIHFDGKAEGESTKKATALVGAGGVEDGFDFLPLGSHVPLRDRTHAEIVASRDGRTARLFLSAPGAASLTRFDAPGQPASETRPMYVLHADGTGGVVRSVYAWSPRVDSVRFDGDQIDITLGHERHIHWQTDAHWQIELSAGHAKSGIELTGWVRGDVPDVVVGVEEIVELLPVTARRLHRGTPAVFELGENNYARSDETWDEAGRPHARATLDVERDELLIGVRMFAHDLVLVPANALNPFDNEPADINGHGVQLYLRTVDESGAWMIVPEADASRARVRPIAGWGALPLGGVTCARADDGFSLQIRVALPALAASGKHDEYPFMLDLIVNETVPGRDRRRGQLVLSGARGEFIYLKGDRHDASRMQLFSVASP